MNGVADELTLACEEAAVDGLVARLGDCLGVRPELGFVEPPDETAPTYDGGVGEQRLEIEQEAPRGQARVDLLEGVHDALDGESSQGVGEERDIEVGVRGRLEVEGAADLEPNDLGEIRRDVLAGSRDTIFVWVNREDGARVAPVGEGQPAIAASELENPCILELAEASNDCGLTTFGVAQVMLKPHGFVHLGRCAIPVK